MAEATTNEVKPSFDSSTYTKAKASISKYFPDEKTQALDALIKETTTTETARLKDIIAATNTSNGPKKGPRNTHTAKISDSGDPTDSPAKDSQKINETTKHATESAKEKELQLFAAIDTYITDRLAQSDNAMITSDPNQANTINFKKSPFGGVIVSLDGSVKPGDMQMRTKEPWRAYEHVFEGTNLTNWRKLPFQDRDRIINEADKKWNEVTATRENAINARNNPTNTVTTAKLPEKKKENTEVAQQAIVTEATALMNRMIDNSAKFSSEFMENKGQGSKRIILNPFGEVQIPSQGGVAATDLQMKNNQIFTAYEEILTAGNLKAWRGLDGDERGAIIDALNTTWNTQAAKKLKQIQETKK